MATKRIYQLVKEFERDEKEIIGFLTEQGIKVTNKLSAVSEETYNMLKAKFAAPPPPPPEPEPELVPEPEPAPSPTPQTDETQASAQPTPPAAGKKKKKKNKSPQTEQAQNQIQEQTKEQPTDEEEDPVKIISDEKIANMDKQTQSVLFAGIKAGNEFIRHYTTNFGQKLDDSLSEKKKRARRPLLSWNMDTWAVLYNHQFEYPDSSPARYWNAVAKLMTRAFQLNNSFGLKNRENLAKMRDAVSSVGKKYEPREIFTDEENQKFEAQQKLLFETFGHGAGLVNDNLYELKLKAERMKVKYERMNFLKYATNPQDELRSPDRVPFNELVEAVVVALRGVARRFYFYFENEERINNIIKCFFEWIDGYAKLKEQGAPAEKLEKYLELEEKFISLVEFMSFDNLLVYKKKKRAPFDNLLENLQEYRDNMDEPDAERNFKYRSRGVINITSKPKEFVFIYQFAGLEPGVDYRPPEVIAAAEAAKATEAAATVAAEDNKE